MSRSLLLIAAILLIPQLVFSQPHPLVQKTLPDPLSTKKGQKIFQDNGCVMCHGAEGRGDGVLAESLKNKPRNFTNYDEMLRIPLIRMEQAIREGLAGTAMPSFADLSEADMEALLNYIRSLHAPVHGEYQICFYQKLEIDAKKLGDSIRIESDDPENFAAELKDGIIKIWPKNWPNLMGKTHMRPTFRIIREEKLYSVIILRLNRCTNELMDLLKTLPCKN
jgi:cytochrome c551/c552